MSGTDADPSDGRATPGDAAVLLIGDELLSGKIRDANGHFLAQTLRRQGIPLLEIRCVGDEPHGIGAALLQLAARATILFTSGGVGPTHDDRTLAAIAAATGRPLMRNAALAEQLTRHYGDRLTDAALSMADLPEGTRLCGGPGWPALRLDLTAPQPCRVYILPGVPGLLRAKIERMVDDAELPTHSGWHLTEIHTTLEESHLAPLLDGVLARFAEVQIGSYPRWSRGKDGAIKLEVRVTLEGRAEQAKAVDAARQALLEQLPADAIIDAPAAPV